MFKYFSINLILVFLLNTHLFSQINIDFDLINAAADNDTIRVAQLIKEGANVNASTYEGVSPLMFAAQNNNLDLVNILLENDANVNAKPWDGTSAHIASAKAGYLEMTEYLIRNGAEIDDVNNENISALMYASAYNHKYIVDMLLYYEANINIIDREGNNAILLAAYYGNTEIIEILIKAGADISSTDFNGNSMLHKAVQSSNIETLKFCTEKGLNIDYLNEDGISPLAMAAKLGDIEIVKLLIKNHAKVDFPEDKSKKPITFALDNNHEDIVAILKENGAKINRMPTYNKTSIGIDNRFSTSTYTTGLSFNLHENKYKTHIIVDMSFRPVKKQVLYKSSENLYYQYWERRYFIGFGLGKYFILMKDNELQKGIYTDILANFSFGGFTGTSNNPNILLIGVPSLGFFSKKGPFEIKLGYEYKNLDTYKLSNHFLYSSIIFYFGEIENRQYIEYLYQ